MEGTEAVITPALAQEHAERSRSRAPGEPKSSRGPKLAAALCAESPRSSPGALALLAPLHLRPRVLCSLFPSARQHPDRCKERGRTARLAREKPLGGGAPRIACVQTGILGSWPQAGRCGHSSVTAWAATPHCGQAAVLLSWAPLSLSISRHPELLSAPPSFCPSSLLAQPGTRFVLFLPPLTHPAGSARCHCSYDPRAGHDAFLSAATAP